MMEHLLTPILVGLLISTTFAIKVTLQGPKYTRRNDIITFNCSTDTPSVGLEAEILINSKTFTNMRTHRNTCFSAVQGLECAEDVCQCSKNGYWFSHTYDVNVDNADNDSLIITCVMKFGADGGYKVSDNISIKIIDPILKVESPLVAGTIARVTCLVLTNLKDVSLVWNCGNDGHEDDTRTSYTYMSVLTFKVKPFQHNTNCTCTGRFEGFQVSSTIQLDVDNKPILNSTNNASCNMSSSVQLSCTLYSEMSSFGFNSWTHIFNGIAVRFLHGVTYGNMLMLNISLCSYQDTGIYICSAWHKFNDKVYHSNSTTTLTFNGPPVVVSSKIVRDIVVTITVNFFSTSDIERPEWFLMSKPIYKTTKMNATVENTTLLLPVYNREIICMGYYASLSMRIYEDVTYTVLLKNAFGKTRKSFKIRSERTVYFDFRVWIFGLSVFGVFLVATTMTILILRGRQIKGVVHIVGPLERSPTIPIYHSAPESHDDEHIYERTNNQYLELIEIPQERHYSDIKEEEDNFSRSEHNDEDDDYEEID